MKRLHELTAEELEEWRQDKMEAGQDEYEDAHLDRNLFVDMVEEVLDLMNISDLQKEKLEIKNEVGIVKAGDGGLHLSINDKCRELIKLIQQWEYRQGEKQLNDEKGGDRIWWPPEDDE